MPDKLMLRPPGSSGPPTGNSTVSRFDFDDDEETSSDRVDFFKGVRRGIKKLGSISGASNRPAHLQLGGDSYKERSSTPTLFKAPSFEFPSRRPQRYDRSPSTSDLNRDREREREREREKPLPRTPLSPPIEETERAQTSVFVPDEALPWETEAREWVSMSRQNLNVGGNRTSTMDSTTSSGSVFGAAYKQQAASTTSMADLMVGGQSGGGQERMRESNANNGQERMGSISNNGQREEDPRDREVLTPRSNGPASAGPSPAQNRASGSRGGAQHLSGLMCNVHRTTGREPHPLVGATTTILGDKLYVFGGRILSRTRPALTSDLYELDLIRRHWSKIEAFGEIPPPRYFHSVCPLGDTKLVCYGGMSPAPAASQMPPVASTQAQEPQSEVVVMSDIHIYDAPTRTWSYIPTQDTPQGRYAHCATILPSSATFSSTNAASSAIQHNLPGSNPNQGTLGVNLDGTGGAEMVVVGGQDSANHYIEQISVFNLRSLKWTMTQQLGKSCGAYRSVVVPLSGAVSARIGQSVDNGKAPDTTVPGSSALIYSNYNFLDVKLELQIRSSDGTLSEKPMRGIFTPPGLRFPNGGVIDTNFVVSGTYLTSSKQEYALWALDLRTLTWSRIDAGGSVFSQGSWNRGMLWNRRNTFVILGNRKRSLVEDYNHRRINFSNVCMVELEAFGLYDNPRKASPMSGFVSASSPYTTPSLNLGVRAGWTAGGRSLSRAAEELGSAMLGLKEMADMDIICAGGERIPVNSRILARRWGPYFVQLLREGAATQDGNDAATLRPDTSVFRHNPSRNSSVTITPSLGGQSTSASMLSTSSTLNANSSLGTINQGQQVDATMFSGPPDANTLAPTSRPRTLYLPHTHLTLQALLYFLYTSCLPGTQSPLCTPQILCSLLQLARPYRVDGLVEAVVERLHGVLDSRNAAAVFNASAMAAGGGRSTSSLNGMFGDGLRFETAMSRREDESEDDEPLSAASMSDASMSESEVGSRMGRRRGKEVWRGEVSAVIGLQKRGLRGLMEGRRLRERGASLGGAS